MTVVLDKRWDVSLEAFYRVAWRREPVRIADSAMQRIRDSRTAFSITGFGISLGGITFGFGG